jgi:ZIP family zinc transporter
MLHEIIYSKHTTAVVLSLVSGLSTGLGGLIVIFFGKPKEHTIGAMLGFASGVMLFVSFVNLVPETAEKIGNTNTAISFMIGMILFHFIIKILPLPSDLSQSEGSPVIPSLLPDYSESDKEGYKLKKIVDPKLLLTGIVVATGIALHNFPEGMAVYMSTLKHYKLGFAIAIAIGLHNVPEGMAVAVSIFASTRSKWEALKYSCFSGLCEPIGAIFFGLLFYGWTPESVIYFMLAGVAGLMVYICMFELITTALNYSGLLITILANIVGMVVLFISSLALTQFEVSE